jgi:hypothetical protein
MPKKLINIIEYIKLHPETKSVEVLTDDDIVYRVTKKNNEVVTINIEGIIDAYLLGFPMEKIVETIDIELTK